ncbi:MAG: GspMb/PilO family protein [Candidatus Omnitrophica bacterium]|nr:GspMb/PilO family protein [Candidatus Omnitrophota bacterium]MDD5552997.1 GspMb/PilO family protein [Candidatus Omnitrophota bacterium]
MKIILTDLFPMAKKRSISIAIAALTLIAASVTFKHYSQRFESLRFQKEEEAKRNGLLTEVNRLEKKIGSYKGLFSSDLASAMEALTDMAEASKLRVVSVKPQPEEAGPLYNKYRLAFILEADSYHDAGRFISGVENQREFYAIDTVDIQRQKTGADQSKAALTVNLTISVISFRS